VRPLHFRKPFSFLPGVEPGLPFSQKVTLFRSARMQVTKEVGEQKLPLEECPPVGRRPHRWRRLDSNQLGNQRLAARHFFRLYPPCSGLLSAKTFKAGSPFGNPAS
jgi:hypothetical protein